MVYPITRRVIPPIIKFFWIKKVTGLENIPEKGAFIVAANHASYMDHFIIVSTLLRQLDRKIHFLAKKEHFDTFLKKTWHNYVGAIPIDREAGGKDALKRAIKALQEERIIGIHPEGTRSLTGKIQEGKTGVARLALIAKVPVIPIGLIGTFEILPKGKYMPKFKKAVMNIGKPIYLTRFYNKKINKKVLREATSEIMAEIAKLSKQRYNF